MTPQLQESRTEFDWQRQPEAATLVAELVDRCIRANPHIARLARLLHEETGTRLVDWVAHLGVAGEPGLEEQLVDAGFEVDPEGRRQRSYRHPDGMFPAIHLAPSGEISSLFVKVESVDDFRKAIEPVLGPMKVSGEAGSQMRQAWFVDDEANRVTSLHAVESHGWPSLKKPENRSQQIAAAAKHRQAFATRRREFADAADGFRHAMQLFDVAAAELGRDWACDLFFAEERRYWMNRNHAGRIQYERQERLGLGWGNHDHHTYRSSRECFAPLIAALVHMGFHKRERFYAGREAGWGAQVLEQSICGFAVFADVDLSPEEVAGDFAHDPLPPRDKLGTVGMWCALHGEAFLEAGMHHLEAQFDFDAARSQLAALGIETLAPFTDWAHLRQAFTRGEMWPVPLARIAAAYAAGHITEEQGNQFRTAGAIGSHLEILERNDGFKGFNQTGVSDIISRTDPRKQ